MTRLFTTFLVWILMAALPLHAVAASVRLSCAPAPQQPGHAATDAAARHADMHAHHGAHAAAEADDAADAAMHHAAASHDAAGSDQSELSHSSCSACSVFCVGAVAPPSASLPLPSFDGSDAVLVAPADSVTGFIPEGLQRPPRR